MPGDYTTGLVFAGFGDDELFPSLECIEIHGVIAGTLKYIELEKVDIDRAGSTGAVIPFAQRDTADRILYGRSDSYEHQVIDHFSGIVRSLGATLVESVVPEPARADYAERVERAVSAAVERFVETVSPEIKRGFFSDILDIIRHMPKAELAVFAEALVNVTSIQRKVTVGPETVGGPIDVAIISKHEGLIWVKRKHYFDAEYNPRYMARSYGQNSRSSDNAE
jgi:hypothetical protein